MTRPILIPTVSSEQPEVLLAPLRDALLGTGPALALGAFDDVAQLKVPQEVALVVHTSGSTNRPRGVLLDAAALTASALATQQRLGGPGQWLLTLPANHVAGIQVLVRSLTAGTTPVFAAPSAFRPETFTADVARMAPGMRRYVSLVPTQLHRLLLDDSPGGVAAQQALRTFDGILVGGAVLHPDLARRAAAEDLQIRTTYGMTETCGGCVYDGVPLPGVQVRTDDTGRIQIAGPVLMRGYLHDDDATSDVFVHEDGVRWLRTNDLGTVSADKRVTVTGRADDVIICGGVNVNATAVEAALAGWNGLAEVCVVPRADAEWGQVPVAAVTLTPHAVMPDLADVRVRVSNVLGAAAAPRTLLVVTEMPTRGPGKYDRKRVQELVDEADEQNPT